MNLKYNCQRDIFVVLFLLSCVKTAGSVKNINKFTFKVKQDFTETIVHQFRKYDLSLLFKIPPTTYIFEYTGDGDGSSVFQTVLHHFGDEIVEAEPVRVYNNTLRPEESKSWDRENSSYGETLNIQTNLVCSHYYGMDVPKVWSSGYTGKGVIFGITDVGINTDLLDLKQNTKEELCHNFINNSKDVAPDVLHNMRSESNHASDHGNRVASIVAATKENNLCSAGIAHNTKFAALKIYEVKSYKGLVEIHPKHWTESDIISKALTHRLDKIDIFVNAWTTTNIFDPLDLGTRESLSYGAGSGRNGLGAIYTFPAGPVGNGVSNTNNTITVNGIGIHGIIPDDAQIDASVLTSGLWQGNNLTASDMVTTTRKNRCITSFKRVSAAVAQVAAIIGLGLEANPNLTVRDVEHLLVRSSEHRRLKENTAFSKNNAGHHFHGIFGFGLLNARKFVTQAKGYMGTPKLEIRYLELSKKRTRGRHTHEFKFCHSCDVSDVKGCLNTLEYVSVKLHFQTSTKHLKAETVSPRNTHSVLMDVSIDQQNSPVSIETTLFSAHFWDEFAFGYWTLKIHSHRDTSETTIRHVSLMLYGTMRSNVASEMQLTFCDKYFSYTSKSPQPTTAQPLPGSAHKEAQGLSGGVIALNCLLPVVVVVISRICYNRRRVNTTDTLPSDQSVDRSLQQLVEIDENDHAQEENSLLDSAERDDDEMTEEENNKT